MKLYRRQYPSDTHVHNGRSEIVNTQDTVTSVTHNSTKTR